MKKQTFLFVSVVMLLVFAGCTRHHAETVVASIGSEPLSLREFEEAYTRMNSALEQGGGATAAEREEFLDLLVKFKLKLRDAYDAGIHEDPAVQQELDEYRRMLTAAYLIEREVTEPAIRRLYDRRTEEIRARHILFRVGQNAPPADTLAAYEQAKAAIERLDQGESFSDLAYELSEDQSARENRGDLFYVTAGMLVRPFEDEMYRLGVGEYTRVPVRTNFGYHVIQVTDRQERLQGIRVSHIMKTVSRTADPEDTLGAYTEIHEILDELRNGADFAELAQEHSTDGPSARRGGEIGTIQRGNLPRDFESLAWSLKPGEVSDVLRTDYGYHIVRVEERIPMGTFEEMRDDLRSEYQRRYQRGDRENFIASLREKYPVERYDGNIDEFIASLDTTWNVNTPAWHDSLDADVAGLALLTVGGDTITARDAALRIQNNPETMGRRLTAAHIRSMLSSVEDNELLYRGASDIGERYPEFARSIEEYRDGILIYYIEDKRIWSNIDLSDENLIAFYEDNKEAYVHPDRVRYCEIVVRSDSLAAALYERIQAGEDMEELAVEYTIRTNMRENRGISEIVPASRNVSSRRAFEQSAGTVGEPFAMRNEHYIIKTLERYPSDIKSFEEARNEVTRDYQDVMSKRLEEEWIASLRERYQVALYPELLHGAFATGDE
jgi:peptidyl-prolyl cis-trans isomerase SurA